MLLALKAVQNLPDIQNQLSSKALFDAFKFQLAKDFAQANFPSDFVIALEPDYHHILEKIANELLRSENKAGFNVMTLLYRIDISEAQLKKYLAEHNDKDHLYVIAELIVKRVLQKVVTKHYYKANQDL